MLLVISPAKNLDYDTPATTGRYTLPQHLNHSDELIQQLRNYSVQDIAELMKLSDKLSGPPEEIINISIQAHTVMI